MPDERYERVNKISWFDSGRLSKSRVVIVGAGAIGQPLVMHMVMNGVRKVVLLDRDRVELHNLPRSPLFAEEDIGKPKAVAAAHRLRQLNPDCNVVAIHGDLEHHVGQGLWRDLRRLSDQEPCVVFGALDNRRARMLLSESCWHWGPLPYVDGGIDGETLTGVVKVFVPRGPESPCYECGLSPEAYASAQHSKPCDPGPDVVQAVPTLSTIAGTVAAMMATAGLKILLGLSDKALANTELYLDMMAHTYLHSRIERNGRCLFDHCIVPEDAVIEAPKGTNALTLDELYQFATEILPRPVRIDFRRDLIADHVTCECGTAAHILKARGALAPADHVCECGRSTPLNADSALSIVGAPEMGRYGETTLAEMGIPQADIVRVSNDRGEELYLQIGSAREIWEAPLEAGVKC